MSIFNSIFEFFNFSVNMAGKGKVGMSDFELLKVLGTGGKFFFVFVSFN